MRRYVIALPLIVAALPFLACEKKEAIVENTAPPHSGPQAAAMRFPRDIPPPTRGQKPTTTSTTSAPFRHITSGIRRSRTKESSKATATLAFRTTPEAESLPPARARLASR